MFYIALVHAIPFLKKIAFLHLPAPNVYCIICISWPLIPFLREPCGMVHTGLASLLSYDIYMVNYIFCLLRQLRQTHLRNLICCLCHLCLYDLSKHTWWFFPHKFNVGFLFCFRCILIAVFCKRDHLIQKMINKTARQNPFCPGSKCFHYK